jgi:tonB-linked outer membrane protein, susC/ragA family
MKSDSFRNNRKALAPLLFCTLFIAGQPLTVRATGNEQSVQTVQQQIKVSGTVSDAMGPVIGVSVVEKGNTSNGTITDVNGNFSLSVPSGATLLISYIGYKAQEVQAVAGRVIDVTLKENTEMLDEVVVVGFGTQKKVNLTGSVGIATAKELESRPVTSAVQALQGLVPGLKISTNTGELDKNMGISIRGTGTIGKDANGKSYSSGSPLILIDGMEGDLNTVNPQDIENISVLKDAAASSIYGSRAPFGVILVTTKSGKIGKTSVNYNANLRISSPINMPKSMDSYSFAVMMNAGLVNSNGKAKFSNETLQNMLDYQAGKLTGGLVPSTAAGSTSWMDTWSTGYANTDLLDVLYKDRVTSQEHNLSINGGSEKMTYYVSLNYLGQNGLLNIGDDGLKRYNTAAKISSTLTKWLKFNYSMRFTRTDNWKPTDFDDNVYSDLTRNWPNQPVKDPNGYWWHPNLVRFVNGGERKTQTDRIYQQAAFVFEPIKNWITKAEFNYSIINGNVKQYILPAYQHDAQGNEINKNTTSTLYKDDTKENYWNLNIFSEYSRLFNESHQFKIMGGFQAERWRGDFFSGEISGLMSEDFPEFNLTTGLDGNGNEKTPILKGYQNRWAVAGFFGRMNYDYKGRYLLEMNLRYDGTSRFRRGNRWKLSPSFSLGWNIAQEKFWQPISNIANLLKLRFSYGELSNQNLTSYYPTYRTMNIYAASGNWLQGGKKTNIASIGDLVSSSLTWESIRTWNAGVDFGLFDNRLTGSFDYFIRYTKDMVGKPGELPATLGIGVPVTNNCDLHTKGWELSIGWKDRLVNGFGYGVNFSLSDQITIIDKYPDNKTNSISSYLPGYKDGLIWGYETIGIAKTQEEMDVHLASLPKGGQDALGSQWSAGDIMYRDLNGDGKISAGAGTLDDHGDMKILGDNYSHYFFGLDLTANWKGLDFRAFFQGALKHDFWPGDNGYFWGAKGSGSEWNMEAFAPHNDYFRNEPLGLEGSEIGVNLNSYFPRPLFKNGGGAKNQYAQSRYVQDARYIRLKNLQIGYTLPKVWTSKIGLENCRVYVSGENLLTFTSLFEMYDPETCVGGAGGNAYPLSRTWSFGLSLTF